MIIYSYDHVFLEIGSLQVVNLPAGCLLRVASFSAPLGRPSASPSRRVTLGPISGGLRAVEAARSTPAN